MEQHACQNKPVQKRCNFVTIVYLVFNIHEKTLVVLVQFKKTLKIIAKQAIKWILKLLKLKPKVLHHT